MRNSVVFLLILMTLGGKGEKSKLGRKRGTAHFVPKTDHEKEVLKSVADRIYGLLNTAKGPGDRATRDPNEDSADLLSSVLSMVLDREGRAPRVESEARVLETLTHIIADASEELRKRKDTADLTHLPPNISPKVVEPAKATHSNDLTKTDEKKKDAVPIPKVALDGIKSVAVLKPINTKVGSSLVKTSVDGKAVLLMQPKKLAEAAMKQEAKEKPAVHAELRADHENAKVSPDSHLKDGTVKLASSPDLAGGGEARQTRDPVLKLTPHVVFTDAEGRKYSLVGVGSRSAGCTGQCLGVDANSKDVLAYKEPNSPEFLVLMDPSGEEFFTTGVQLCDEVVTSAKPSRHVRMPTNLAFLALHNRREIAPNPVSVTWQHEAVQSNPVKREDSERYQDFSQDVETLFKGAGMNAVSEKKPKLSPAEVLDVVNRKSKKNRRRRKQHARLFRRKRANKSKIKPAPDNEHGRTKRDSPDYYEYDGDSYVEHPSINGADNVRTEMEVKLLDELKKDKKNFEDFTRNGYAKVDVERCKRHCEAQGMGPKRSPEVEDHIRTRRSSDFNLLPFSLREQESPSTNYSATDSAQPNEFLSMEPVERMRGDGKVKIIAIEPESQDPVQAMPLTSDEEINMIQPNTAPDVEDKVLLTRFPDSKAKKTELPQNKDEEIEVEDIEEVEDEGTSLSKPEEPEIVEKSPGAKMATWLTPLKSPDVNPPINFPLAKEYLKPKPLVTLAPDEGNAPSLDLNAEEIVDRSPAVEAAVASHEAALATATPEEELEGMNKLSSAEKGTQFAEAILYRVQHSFKMKDIFGTGLKTNPPAVHNAPSPHQHNHSSVMQILLKTLMMNLEKLAEQDAEQNNCHLLETDLQEFLGALLGLPSNPTLPDQYKSNVGFPRSYAHLQLHKNELLELLKEYHNLPEIEKEQSPGVKSFIEGELDSVEKDVDKKASERYKRLIRGNIEFIGEKRDEDDYYQLDAADYKTRVETTTKSWLDSINPFKGINFTKMNPFIYKAEPKPHPFPLYLDPPADEETRKDHH